RARRRDPYVVAVLFALSLPTSVGTATDRTIVLSIEEPSDLRERIRASATEAAKRVAAMNAFHEIQTVGANPQQPFDHEHLAYIHVAFQGDHATVFVLDPETESIAAREVLLDGDSELVLETLGAVLESTLGTLLDGTWVGEPLGELRRRYADDDRAPARIPPVTSASPPWRLGAAVAYEGATWPSETGLR